MVAEAALRLDPEASETADPPLRARARRTGRVKRAPGPRPVPAARPAPPEPLGPEERARVLAAFRGLLPVPGNLEPSLSAVLRDLLDHPGSLARAQLAYILLRDLPEAGVPGAPDTDGALRLAIAVEYFHSASLVFDDLPSMDDATERRGRPCPHMTHGEGPAVLGALALINRAYGLLWSVLARLEPERAGRAAALVEECLGATGILDGQARDLAFEPARSGADDVLRVALGKTVPLVRLSLVLPALVAGAPDEDLERLEELSVAWGLAYQVLDDFKDLALSREETGKSTARDRALGRPNLPAVAGRGPAMARLAALLARSRALVDALERSSPAWRGLRPLAAYLDDERRRLVLRMAEERS